MQRRLVIAGMIMLCAGSVAYRAQKISFHPGASHSLSTEIDVTTVKKANNCSCLEQFGYCPCAESKRQGKIGCGCSCQ